MKKSIYIFLFFVFASTACYAVAVDSTQLVPQEINAMVEERSFDQGELSKAKQNPDFQYDINRKLEQPSWLDKIFYKIISFILNLLFSPTGSAESIIFYVICIALVVGLVLVIMRMNSVGMFSRKNVRDGEGLDFSEFSEDINTIDFDRMIEEAVSSRMYRRAVRLYYLKALKQLSDRSQILWEINKTNRDYLYELKSPQLRAGFEDITYVYEYVWYGNVEIDEEKFSKLKTSFHQFSNLTSATR